MTVQLDLGLKSGRAESLVVDSVADGYEAFALAEIARQAAPGFPLLYEIGRAHV